MKTTGEEIFHANAVMTLRDMDIRHLDPAHGAAVDIVRWCLAVRGRPTHHRQTFLERESPALLAYLEALAASGDASGWRTLEERIRLRAELLRETGQQPCARPWLAAIWHALPEFVAIGQAILDRQARKDDPAPGVVPIVSGTSGSTGGDDADKGGSGKAGSAGTAAKPRPAARLTLPVVSVVLTDAEKKTLDPDEANGDDTKDGIPDDPELTDGPKGPKGLGGKQ